MLPWKNGCKTKTAVVVVAAAAEQKHLPVVLRTRKTAVVQVTAINWNVFGHCCGSQMFLGLKYAPSWVCMLN